MQDFDADKIELLVLDVDGVMTDGRVILTPAGDEIKSFHVRDGSGIKYWQRVGKRVAIISGRGSDAVLRRAEELSIDPQLVRLNAKNKLPQLEQVLELTGCSPEQTAVMGDDLTDIPLFRTCGFSAAVADAADELKSFATYVTHRPGGQGCVREVIEMLLKQAGRWEQILQRYIPADEDAAS